MAVKRFVFLPSTRVQTASVITEWFEVDMFFELMAFLELTAQGTYTNETLDVTIQTRSPNGNAHDLESFAQIGNKTAALPFYDYEALTNFGAQIRFKLAVAGTAKDYTLSLTGYAKE